MKLAARAAGLEPSITLALAAQAKALRAQGHPVIDLTAGEPDFPTPEPIQEAAREAMRQGYTKYSPAAGFADLREAVAAKFARDQKWKVATEDVLVSNGAKHAISNMILALVGPGDRVIIPVPYWLSYPSMVRVAGGEAVLVPPLASDPRRPDPVAIGKAVREGARVLILNSPSNPSGAVLSAEETGAILREAGRCDCWVLSDEIYEFLVYDGQRHVSPAEVRPDLRDRTIVVSGVSKSYAMTGWRIGYAAGPRAAIAAATAIQSHTTSGPNSIAQRAALRALQMPLSDLAKMREIFQSRRDVLCEALDRIGHLRASRPEGAFYAWADVRDLMRRAGVAGADALCQRWLAEAHVATTPGTAFGAEGYVRFSYAIDEAALRDAGLRLRAWTERAAR